MKCPFLKIGSIFFVFLLAGKLVAQDQSVADSLGALLQTNINDQERVDVLINLARQYVAYDNEKTVQYSQQAMQLSDNGGKFV